MALLHRLNDDSFFFPGVAFKLPRHLSSAGNRHTIFPNYKAGPQKETSERGKGQEPGDNKYFQKLQAKEMAPLVRCLLCKLGYLESDLQDPCEVSEMTLVHCSDSAGEAKT